MALLAGVIAMHCAVRAALADIQLLGVPQPKPMHEFSPNFQGMFSPIGSRVDYVLGVSGNNCCHGNTFKIFGLKVCGCSTA